MRTPLVALVAIAVAAMTFACGETQDAHGPAQRAPQRRVAFGPEIRAGLVAAI